MCCLKDLQNKSSRPSSTWANVNYWGRFSQNELTAPVFPWQFLLNKSNISRISTNYNFDMEVYPFNCVKLTSRNSITNSVIPSLNYICFSVFVFICSQDWLLYFPHIFTSSKIFSFFLCLSIMLNLYLKWTEHIIPYNMSRPWEKSVSITLCDILQ